MTWLDRSKNTTASTCIISTDTFSADGVDLPQISLSLARMPMFFGHGIVCVYASFHAQLVAEFVDRRHKIWALLNSAHKAYMGDMPDHVLRFLSPDYDLAVRKIKRTIFEAITGRNITASEASIVAEAEASARRMELSVLFGVSDTEASGVPRHFGVMSGLFERIKASSAHIHGDESRAYCWRVSVSDALRNLGIGQGRDDKFERSLSRC